MQRFFLENLETTNYKFEINDKELINQIVKVLRSKIWDKFIFFDWTDETDYICELKEICKKELKFEQVWNNKNNSEIKFELNLFQSLPNKLDKIESIIKNWTQIGISNFLFFKSERSQKLNLTDKKIDRLNKIALESSELSWRNIIPKVIIWDKLHFSNLEWKNYIFHTKNDDSILLKDIKINNSEIINLFIWPEWWFSEKEMLEFYNNDFGQIYLWNRILRTELAWITSAFWIIQNNS